MSGIGGAIANGIDSATYNPEAEKARKEARAAADKKKEDLRKLLFSYRDSITNKPNVSGYVQKKVSASVDASFQWLQQNPLVNEEDYRLKTEAVKQEYTDLFSVNDLVLTLQTAPKVIRLQADKLLLEKRLTEVQKDSLYKVADTVQSFVNGIDSKSLQEIRTQFQQIQEAYKKELPENSLTADVAQAASLEKQVTAQVKADQATFNPKRLLSETYRIALKVVGSLFIGMLILVSGMLTANDAIGRDPQYRILYFLFGGLGFPVMLFYYLYRWFSGTAPHIYRLLPLYSTAADTSLGRFFLYPFTYVEDQGAKDAYTKFMTDAAKLVGKEYTPPAEAISNKERSPAEMQATMGDKLGSLLEGIQGLALNSIVPGKRGVNSILKGMETMKL